MSSTSKRDPPFGGMIDVTLSRIPDVPLESLLVRSDRVRSGAQGERTSACKEILYLNVVKTKPEG